MLTEHASALADATAILEKFVSADGSVSPMYKKNIGLVTLELAFQNPSGLLAGVTDPDKASSRVMTLYLILEQCMFQRSAFDDVKDYIGQLTLEEAKYFVDNFSKILLGKVCILTSHASLSNAPSTHAHRWCRNQTSREN